MAKPPSSPPLTTASRNSYGAVGHAGVALQLLDLLVIGAEGFLQRPTVGADLIEHRGAIGCLGILQCLQLDAADCWDRRLGETVAHRDQYRLDLAEHHRFMRDLRCRFQNGQALHVAEPRAVLDPHARTLTGLGIDATSHFERQYIVVGAVVDGEVTAGFGVFPAAELVARSRYNALARSFAWAATKWDGSMVRSPLHRYATSGPPCTAE